MKIFNSVEELWKYCLYCPICRELGRTIILEVGPDDNLKLSQALPYQKMGAQLKLFGSFQMEIEDPDYVQGQCSATFNIDCDSNQYWIEASGNQLLANKVHHTYFYFYVNATCKKCHCSWLNSWDMEFDSDLKIVNCIQIEREGYFLIAQENKYYVVQSYDPDISTICRINVSETERQSELELPLVKLDFSDIPKLINKIETLILFS